MEKQMVSAEGHVYGDERVAKRKVPVTRDSGSVNGM